MRVQSKTNRNSDIAAKAFPHVNLLTLDNALRKTLHGQTANFPLSEALHASARLGTKTRQHVLRLGNKTRVVRISWATAVDKIAEVAKQQIAAAMGRNYYGFPPRTICVARLCYVDDTIDGTDFLSLSINPQWHYKEYAGCYSLIAK